MEISDVEIVVIALLSTLLIVLIAMFFRLNKKFSEQEFKAAEQTRANQQLQDSFQQTRSALLEAQGNSQSKMEQRFGEVQHALEKRLGEMSQVSVERFGGMQQSIEKRLGEMSKDSIESFAKSNNEQRLDKGFEKTTETFTDVVKRLALIDEAQKRITELSSNVVSLQEVLTDKRSRGAFGEVQMAGLISNVMPEGSYALQHTLSNSTRVDCMMFLPEPTGHIAIDSKFPLDSFQKMMDNDATDIDRTKAEKQFRLDIKKHIKDISEKYIIEGETADGAIMLLKRYSQKYTRISLSWLMKRNALGCGWCHPRH